MDTSQEKRLVKNTTTKQKRIENMVKRNNGRELIVYINKELEFIKSLYHQDIYSDKFLLPHTIRKFDRELAKRLPAVDEKIANYIVKTYGKNILNEKRCGILKNSINTILSNGKYANVEIDKTPFFVLAIRTLGKDFKPFLKHISEKQCKYVDVDGNILAQIMLNSDVRTNSICLDVITKYPKGVYHTNNKGEALVHTASRAFRSNDVYSLTKFVDNVNKITPIVSTKSETSDKTGGR